MVRPERKMEQKKRDKAHTKNALRLRPVARDGAEIFGN